MKLLLKNLSRVITLGNNGVLLNSPSEEALSILDDYSIIIENNLIKDFAPNGKIHESKFETVIDCSDKIALPGLVECHTHTVFTGSRTEEFKLKLKGVSYEEIARKGGGINSTVNAVRRSSTEDLINAAIPRINKFIAQGITTLEIKSGYGLDFENEIKLLTAIKKLNALSPIDVIPTFLGAHTYPAEFSGNHPEYLSLLTDKLIPFVASNKLAEACDAFCEVTAFSPDEVERVFSAAKKFGMRLKLHTDQFNSIGGIDVALKFGATSVEHLEVVRDDDIRKLKGKNIIAVLLPGVSFFLKHKYAPAKKLIENNIPIALSTDFNPGSSNILNIHLIMQLAAFKMNLTAEQILPAVTLNAAKALGLSNKIGSLEIGKKADVAIFNAKDYADIIYNVGQNITYAVVKNGKLIYSTE